MKRVFLLLVSAILFFNAECATYTGTIFCDNWFKLFVNGKLVKVDPVNFTPHQAVSFTFEDDQLCRTYAVYATDSGDDATGLEYDNTCVGDGGIKITISDGTVSSNQWNVKVIQRGPTNWKDCYSSDKTQKCIKTAATTCTTETLPYESGTWCLPQTSVNGWANAVEHSDGAVGYGKKPSATNDTTNCIDPRTVTWGDAKFIWTDDLDYDNKLLFRYTKCDNAATNTVSVSGTCPMDKPESTMTCGGTSDGAAFSGSLVLAILLSAVAFFI